MKLLKFNQYINEAREIPAEEREKLLAIKPTADRLNSLMQKGLIDDSGYRKKMLEITNTVSKVIKGLKLNPREEEDLEILKQIGSDIGLDALDALSSEGARALAAKGLHLVSSPTQIANGTLVWSIDPNYRSANGWGLGFFPRVRMVRRMTPKQVNLGVRWGLPGAMDVKIKQWKWSDHSSALDFYDKAMQWAAENIDFEDVKLKPEPDAWKYYTKRTTGGKGQFNQEIHDLTLQVTNLLNTARQNLHRPIPSLNFQLQAWTLKRKIGELENDPEKIAQAEAIITRINNDIESIRLNDIERLKNTNR